MSASHKVYNWQLKRHMEYKYPGRPVLKNRRPGFLTPISVLPARPALWPVRTPGHQARARSICGGIMWKPNPGDFILWAGMCVSWR